MSNYSFNVFWSEEDEAYIATCPQFPRLSAFGDTPQEALSEIEVAVGLAIEVYTERGWPLPQAPTQHDYSGQFRLRLPKSLHMKLAQQAEIEGVSLNSLTTMLISEGLGTREGLLSIKLRPGVTRPKRAKTRTRKSVGDA